MDLLIKLWKIVDGKKRTIANVYWAVLIPSMLVVWPEGYPQGFPLIFYKCATIFGLILTSIGLGHASVKSVKSYLANKEANSIEAEQVEVNVEGQIENEVPVVEEETEQIEKKVEGQVNA